MHVLATAGHVDHGKSTLVRALTGMEPDRWAEERRRGMTIDLGYAWTTLPTGGELAFVDVPGHERFIGNMLTGLGPVPAVLFVVAADEGWARQSTEHLAAVDALGLEHGLLVVTRSDLADPSAAREESLDRIRRSSLGDVESVAVSPVTGHGLDRLRTALSTLVARLPAAQVEARIRFWVDRSFSVRGAGTIVTGTLGQGTIAIGDELVLGRQQVVVRGLQSLGRPVERVGAVARVALNLRSMAASEIGRGDVLLSPGRWHHTRLVDVHVDHTDPLPNGLVLHVGTAALAVHVRPLGPGVARLTLPRALPLLAGDRGVLLDPGRHAVAAGVLVLDADPPELRRRGDARRRADDLAAGRPSGAAEVARRGAVRRDHLAALGVPPPDPADARPVGDWLVSPAHWERWRQAALAAVLEWAERNPLEPRMPRAALRRALDLPDDGLLDALVSAAGLFAGEGRVWSTESGASRHRPLGGAEAGVRELERRLAIDPFRAPEREELGALGLGLRELAAAEKAGRLLRIGPDIVLLPDAAEQAVAGLASLPQPFTTSAARQALATTRRVAIPLLEHLDRLGLTVRVDGQLRTLSAPPR